MLTQWLRSNKLSLKIDKATFKVTSRRKFSNEIELSIGRPKLGLVASIKLLAITVGGMETYVGQTIQPTAEEN